MANAQELFDVLQERIGDFLHRRQKGDANRISQTLDELNRLDYRYPVVNNPTKAILLVNQLVALVKSDDRILVPKICKLITSLINIQKILFEGRTLIIAVEWTTIALKHCANSTLIILRALECMLKTNLQKIYSLAPLCVFPDSKLLQLATSEASPEVTELAVLILDLCCTISDDYKTTKLSPITDQWELCAQIFLKWGTSLKKPNFDHATHNKILISSLRGLQNVILVHKTFLPIHRELILGITRTYMVYKLKDIEFLMPQKVIASQFSIPEAASNILREKKGGKVTRLRKQRLSGAARKGRRSGCSTRSDESYEPDNRGYKPAAFSVDFSDEPAPAGGRARASDSDYSDSEGGILIKIGSLESRLRQAALNLLLQTIMLTSKMTVFSYWTNFVPGASLTNTHTITNCILKDPNAKGREVALNVLLCLLSGAKMYLAQAEHSDRTSAFTPLSVTLGSIIKELHHCLSLALNETSYPVLTQVLKCYASLVQATPYHRLRPGLASKVIRNVKGFIYHRDTTIQVAALIVLGCLVASEPPVAETIECLLRNIRRAWKPNTSPATDRPTSSRYAHTELTDDFDHDSMSSDEELHEPITEDHVPWLLRRCLQNLGIKFPPRPGATHQRDVWENVTPLVRLESLQVISVMGHNHFERLIQPFLPNVTKALENGLTDGPVEVKKHAGQAVNFIGQALSQRLVTAQALNFWHTLLNGPLVRLLQNENPALRMVGCDALGSIGAETFEQLSRDRQLLCITTLFASSRDEDPMVKGSAVRALAMFVLYPVLCEDPGFVVDVAETILRSMADENVGLKVKASWSLANLSNALVLNKSDPDVISEVGENLLHRMLKESVEGCKLPKIRPNAVRSIGNLVQIIDARMLDDEMFYNMTKSSIECLIEAATSSTHMKVRWNACYALGNALHNDDMYKIEGWLETTLDSFGVLVKDFKNFKVRINAALALQQISKRVYYGNFYKSTWVNLIHALENSENMEDFKEFQHRDHLIEQICLALAHLTTLMEINDVVPLQHTFSESSLKAHIQRVYHSIVPEKTTVLLHAAERVATLAHQNVDQKEVLTALKNVFRNDLMSSTDYPLPEISCSDIYRPSRMRFPKETAAQLPEMLEIQFPRESKAQFPTESEAQFSAESWKQFPVESANRFPIESEKLFPVESGTRFPEETKMQFRGMSKKELPGPSEKQLAEPSE